MLSYVVLFILHNLSPSPVPPAGPGRCRFSPSGKPIGATPQTPIYTVAAQAGKCLRSRHKLAKNRETFCEEEQMPAKAPTCRTGKFSDEGILRRGKAFIKIVNIIEIL